MQHTELRRTGKFLLFSCSAGLIELGSTPELALGILGEIMCACGLEPSCVVNNSHLQNLTTAETITEALDYGNEVARKLEVPLLCTTAPNKLMNDKKLENYNLYYVEPIVKPPFGQQA